MNLHISDRVEVHEGSLPYCRMALEYYAYLMLIADFTLLISLPLQLRLLYIFLSKKSTFVGIESDFYKCFKQILIVDLLAAFISILIVEPATLGMFREFFENNSGWISKLAIFQVSPLRILSTYFHSLIAVNRLTAMVFTLHHRAIWTPRVLKCLHFAGWFLVILFSLPLIWPIHGSYTVLKSPFGNRGLTFVLTTSFGNIPYQVIPLTINTFLEVATLIFYCIIVIKAREYEKIASIVIRSTVASLIMCSTGWFLILFISINSYYGHVEFKDLFPIEVYYALFKFGFAINGSISSWVVLFMFKDIRYRVISCDSRSRSSRINPLIDYSVQSFTTSPA